VFAFDLLASVGANKRENTRCLLSYAEQLQGLEPLRDTSLLLAPLPIWDFVNAAIQSGICHEVLEELLGLCLPNLAL
jgi:hypothetical protein